MSSPIVDDATFYSLAVFVPVTHADAVRSALATAGGGSVGEYDSCSFSSLGVGRFRPLAGAAPHIGKAGGAIESVAEERIETEVLGARLHAVLRAVRAAHPYEQPAIHVKRLERFSFPPASPRAAVCIVLEGLDGVGKSTAAVLLAHTIGAQLLRTPGAQLLPFRSYIDARPHLRPGYYETCNFIASAEMATAAAEGRAVVCDRYFASTRAYQLARAGELPPVGDAAYDWPPPDMLLRPSHLIQLVLPQEQRIARRAARVEEAETKEEEQLRKDAEFAERVVVAYDRLGCVRVSAEGSREDVVARIRAACGL